MTTLSIVLLAAANIVGQLEPGSTHEHIKDLGYFVGTWTMQDDAGKDGGQVSCEWVNGKNFLMWKSTSPLGGTSMSMLGWDPTSKKITEWGFGEYGGFGTIIWDKAGDQKWTSKTKEPWIRWNGDKFDVTTTTTIADKDHCTMETIAVMKEQTMKFTTKMTRVAK